MERQTNTQQPHKSCDEGRFQLAVRMKGAVSSFLLVTIDWSSAPPLRPPDNEWDALNAEDGEEELLLVGKRKKYWFRLANSKIQEGRLLHVRAGFHGCPGPTHHTRPCLYVCTKYVCMYVRMCWESRRGLRVVMYVLHRTEQNRTRAPARR